MQGLDLVRSGVLYASASSWDPVRRVLHGAYSAAHAGEVDYRQRNPLFSCAVVTRVGFMPVLVSGEGFMLSAALVSVAA